MPVTTRSQHDKHEQKYDMIAWQQLHNKSSPTKKNQTQTPTTPKPKASRRTTNHLEVSRDIKELHKLFSRLSIK